MSKYEKLDALIIASLSEPPKMFSAINVGEVARECERIAYVLGGESFRVCDRRLQALRKAGKIMSTSRGWIWA